MEAEKASATTAGQIVKVEARLLGERLDTRAAMLPGFDVVMQTPRVLRNLEGVMVALFRFGAVVIACPAGARFQFSLVNEYVQGAFEPVETEVVAIQIGEGGDHGSQIDDLFAMVDVSIERFVVLATALAKSTALARDERRIGAVFESLEPFARDLACSGGRALTSFAPLKLLGEALLAQHRMVGRVEVDEKPDILWERPDLQRLNNRLDEEYELSERGRGLSRKLKVIEETASALADVADTYISRRLEIAIIVLIVLELVLSMITLIRG